MLAGTDHDTLDAGPRKTAPGSERFCAATGEVKPVAELIRFVVAPDGAVVPDLKRRLPGRGLWITATRHALATAIARKAFARGFKRDVRVSAELLAATERLLERAALDALAMAHKAGKLTTGFAKVEAALARAPVVALLHAAEAHSDGVRKLAGALGSRPERAEIAVIRAFTSTQLDLALGRANVVHAALLAGPESDTFLARTARLDCFRAGPNCWPTPGLPGGGKKRRPLSDLSGGGNKSARKSVTAEARRDGLTEHGGKSENR
jgi:predicted RNA-binding protein YlxR (DUF448 family)